jgi:type IV pilus assembly protein PilP
MKRILIPIALLLAGCSESNVKEIRGWMDETRAATVPHVQPLSEPKTFIPVAYADKDSIDPFNPNKLLAELAKAADNSNNPFKPDMSRRKELLESFPLDTFHMVGMLRKGADIVALVQVENVVYQIRPGQHIGQNYGMVTGVTENAVNIREVVQDASGEWTERPAKLELQESKENKK